MASNHLSPGAKLGSQYRSCVRKTVVGKTSQTTFNHSSHERISKQSTHLARSMSQRESLRHQFVTNNDNNNYPNYCTYCTCTGDHPVSTSQYYSCSKLRKKHRLLRRKMFASYALPVVARYLASWVNWVRDPLLYMRTARKYSSPF